MSILINLINNFPIGNPAEKGYWLYRNVPSAVLNGMEAGNFKATVQFAAEHSKFYKRRFRELEIDAFKIQKPEDLGDFFTTAEDIRNYSEEFICLKPDTAFETTGTTSKKPKRIYFSRQEVREAGWAGAVGLWGVGVRPEDKIASAFDYSFWVSGPVLQASCEVLGCFHVEAGRIPPADFYERLMDYKPTVVVGDPSWIYGLSEIAEKKGAWPMKLLIGGGENFTESQRAYVEKVWKAPFLLSYGQTEAFGAIGMESLDKEGYILNEFHNLFEVVGPDKDGYGELVYTTLNRRVMPLIRYKSGDVTKFLSGVTKSGLTGKRISKLKGRLNEWVPTAMGNIAPWMFESLFDRIAQASVDWQIVIEKDRNNQKDVLNFLLESDNETSSDHLKQNFFREFEKELSDAWKQHQMGLFHLEFHTRPKGTLRQGRKLIRILDRRSFL